MNGNKVFSDDYGSFKAPIFLLRLEGLALFCLSLYLFYYSQGSWLLFAALFFVPDLSLGGYLLGPRIGAMFYNIFHAEIGPVLLAGSGLLAAVPILLQLALIWFCHINFDRALGIGLKYSDKFEHTHLGVIRFGKWK